MTSSLLVIPAKAGIQESMLRSRPLWIPAVAGMNGGVFSTEHDHD